MQTESKQLIKNIVFGVAESADIAEVKGYIIDPAGLKIIALRLEGLSDHKKYYLLPVDIKLRKRKIIYVNSLADISLAEDLPRQQEYIASNYSPIGSRVETDDGKKLGKVADFTVDCDNYYIKKLRVSPPLLGRVMSTGLLIDRSNIINILPNLIVVESDKIRARNTATKIRAEKTLG